MITPIQAWLAQTILRSPNAKARGTAGELLAVELLKQSGYFAGRTAKYSKSDVVVFDHSVQRSYNLEVKVSLAGYQGTYKFCLRKESAKGKTDYRKADYLMLICVSKSGSFTVFVMNTVNVGDVWYLSISGNPVEYRGKYRQYQQRSNRVVLPCNIVADSGR